MLSICGVCCFAGYCSRTVSVKFAVLTNSISPASVELLTVLLLILIIMGVHTDGGRTPEQGTVCLSPRSQAIAIKSKQTFSLLPALCG